MEFDILKEVSTALSEIFIDNDALVQVRDQIDVDAIFDRLNFPNKKKQGEKWWHTCTHPKHVGAQSGKSPPARFNPDILKSKCYSCRGVQSLVEMIKHFTGLEKRQDILAFLGLSDAKIDWDAVRWNPPPPRRRCLDDDLFGLHFYHEIDKDKLKFQFDHPEFIRRGFTQEFQEKFHIQICTDYWWGGRYVVPFFAYVEQLREHRLFGWEARRLTEFVEPKVMTPPGGKLNRILAGEYMLKRNEPLIIVEGFPDMAKIWTHFTRNVTTPFTNYIFKDGIINQFDKLKKFKKLICFADNDEGGRAMEQCFLELAEYTEVYVARLEVEGQDPNDATVAENEKAIKGARPIFDFYKKSENRGSNY